MHQESTHRYCTITAFHHRILLNLWGTDCLDIVGKDGKIDQLLVNADNRDMVHCVQNILWSYTGRAASWQKEEFLKDMGNGKNIVLDDATNPTANNKKYSN